MYEGTTWGVLVQDADSGRILYSINPGKLIFPASVAKLFTVAAAIGKLGPGYHYETKVYVQGNIDQSGVLHGGLIFRAAGDLSLGGREDAHQRFLFAKVDHINLSWQTGVSGF